jgi:hypothetical protein
MLRTGKALQACCWSQRSASMEFRLAARKLSRPTGTSRGFCYPPVQGGLKSALRQNRSFVEPFQSDLACPDARAKIFSFTKIRSRTYPAAVPLRQEGRFAIVTNAGRDAMDVKTPTDERRLSRTAKTCGPGTPWLVSSPRDNASAIPPATVTKRSWTPRRARP